MLEIFLYQSLFWNNIFVISPNISNICEVEVENKFMKFTLPRLNFEMVYISLHANKREMHAKNIHNEKNKIAHNEKNSSHNEKNFWGTEEDFIPVRQYITKG